MKQRNCLRFANLILERVLDWQLPNQLNREMLARVPLFRFTGLESSFCYLQLSSSKFLTASLHFARANLLYDQPRQALNFAAVSEFLANEVCFSTDFSEQAKLVKTSAAARCGLVYDAINQLVNINTGISQSVPFEVGNDLHQNKRGFLGFYKSPWSFHDDLTPFDDRNLPTVEKFSNLKGPKTLRLASKEFLFCKLEILAQIFASENLEKLEYSQKREAALKRCCSELRQLVYVLIEEDFLFILKNFLLERMIILFEETINIIKSKTSQIIETQVGNFDHQISSIQAQQKNMVVHHTDKISDLNPGESKIKALVNIYQLTVKLFSKSSRFASEYEMIKRVYGVYLEDSFMENVKDAWCYTSQMRLESLKNKKEIDFLKEWLVKLQTGFKELLIRKKSQDQEDLSELRARRVVLVYRAKLLELKILKNLNYFSEGFVQARDFVAKFQYLLDGSLYYRILRKHPNYLALLPDSETLFR